MRRTTTARSFQSVDARNRHRHLTQSVIARTGILACKRFQSELSRSVAGETQTTYPFRRPNFLDKRTSASWAVRHISSRNALQAAQRPSGVGTTTTGRPPSMVANKQCAAGCHQAATTKSSASCWGTHAATKASIGESRSARTVAGK